MAKSNLNSARHKSIGEKVGDTFSGLFKMAIFAAVIVFIVFAADGYTTSVAPAVKRCEICGAEVSEWYTVSFEHTESWDSAWNGETHSGDYFAPYTLCYDCAAGVKGYIAWRLAGSP